MLTALQWYVAAAILAGILALFAILGNRQRRFKFAALACTALFLPLCYFVTNDLLSRPKPLDISMAKSYLNNSIVTASLMREDEAIYLWLQMPDIAEPRAYKLPWNEQMAIELHEAEREAEVEGTEVQMQLPQGDTTDTDMPLFEATSHVAPPPKET